MIWGNFGVRLGSFGQIWSKTRRFGGEIGEFWGENRVRPDGFGQFGVRSGGSGARLGWDGVI